MPSPHPCDPSVSRLSVDPEALPILSAEKLHKIILRCRGTQNRVRYVLLSALHALHQSKRFFELGFPSIVAYAQKVLGYRKSATYEALRVVAALADLPRTTERFLEGALSWTALRQISRIATAETEESWLTFAEKNSPDRVQAEVEDALKKNRDRPRADGFGLPNLETYLKVPLSLSELEIVQKGIDAIARELSANLGGESVGAKDVLLFVAERALSTTSADPMEGRPPRLDPHYTIVYQQCLECRQSHLATPAGAIEVDFDVVARVEGDAYREEIRSAIQPPPPQEVDPEVDAMREPGGPSRHDPPNSRRLSRRVRLRDGLLCTNPHCCRVARHSHHIRFRSHGGATAMRNETAVCEICHALIHLGRLRVQGSPRDGLKWSTSSDGITIDLAEEQRAIASLPVIRTARTPSPFDRAPLSDSTAVEKRPPGTEAGLAQARREFEHFAGALRRLGYSKSDAEHRVGEAIRTLIEEGTQPSEQDVLQRALRGTARPSGHEDRFLSRGRTPVDPRRKYGPVSSVHGR